MRTQSKIIIGPQVKMKLADIRELWSYKDLLYYMVLRDITVQYKQTILGLAWAIINPLFQILIFSLIFSKLSGIRPDVAGMPYPLFSALAVIPWTYFSSSFTAGSASLVNTSSIFTKVYFPRIIIPLTPVISKLFDFFISLTILVILMVYYNYYPGINIIYFFWPLFVLVTTTAGLSFLFSALSLQYRDVRFALQFLVTILLYAAPIVFPATLIQEKFGTTMYYVYACYPLVGGIQGFRECYAHDAFPVVLVSISTISSLILFFLGLTYFKKTENYFADVA